MTEKLNEDIHREVRQHYAAAISNTGCGCDSDGCCPPAGYKPQLLTEIPSEITAASMGCGDPITLASLQSGEVVLDLGSGAGLDCFFAARQVGPEGYVIGIDMTPEMIERARSNQRKLGLENVEFRPGLIEEMPVESGSVDVVISNCVINLAPDKGRVFAETFRVLKAGGRIAVSDVVTEGHFSDQARADITSWAACISGALEIGEYRAMLEAAGFVDIQVEPQAPETSASPAGEPHAFSARFKARKPL
jgi:SAM-dependent methyltransferase